MNCEETAAGVLPVISLLANDGRTLVSERRAAFQSVAGLMGWGRGSSMMTRSKQENSKSEFSRIPFVFVFFFQSLALISGDKLIPDLPASILFCFVFFL